MGLSRDLCPCQFSAEKAHVLEERAEHQPRTPRGSRPCNTPGPSANGRGEGSPSPSGEWLHGSIRGTEPPPCTAAEPIGTRCSLKIKELQTQ